MRFANKLEFGEKAHEVSMTAQRLVQRMMKDSIHSGRRPSGLCGAALLIAARMHEYSRTPMDIVRIVKIHESTLRKRLIEFGDTPSSLLTLDEFMAVDLEAEQDPPAFKAARKRDRERLQKVAENSAEFTELQIEIDSRLERDSKKMSTTRKRRADGSNHTSTSVIGADFEGDETDVFIRESTMHVISECMEEAGNSVAADDHTNNIELRPDIAAMCIPSTKTNEEQIREAAAFVEPSSGELDLSDLDDEEINGYIMTEHESRYKLEMWKQLNKEYLAELQEKEERLAKEKEEGKPEKKRRRASKKRHIGPSNTAGEAIEKMLQEKKISNKINYDILKALTEPKVIGEEVGVDLMPLVDETPAEKKWSLDSVLLRFVNLILY